MKPTTQLEALIGEGPLSDPGARRRGPRPPYRPGIPALRRGAPVVQPLAVARGLTTARYVGDEVPGEKVLAFTIHDGDKIPHDLPDGASSALAGSAAVRRAYRRERDWGANLVARHLARDLGLGGFVKVDVARAVLDLGRLPGCSPAGVPHLKRRSIFAPAGGLLSPEAKHRLLADGYDRIDRELTRRMDGKALAIAIHTYDPFDADGARRPALSLIAGRESGRPSQPLPLCDPRFALRLCGAVCDGALAERVRHELAVAGRPAALNRPYEIHEGSVEFRAQARSFFAWLERRFHAAFPDRQRVAYRRLWDMLGDVTRRSADCWALRCHLLDGAAAPAGREWLFADARRAYRELESWWSRRSPALLHGYRFAAERPGSLALEVRKDVLCELDDAGEVAGLRRDAEPTAREIARAVAVAVAGFVRHALPAEQPAARAL